MTKVTTLAEAVASIPSGAHVSLSGFAITRCTMAFAHEVIRQGMPTISFHRLLECYSSSLFHIHPSKAQGAVGKGDDGKMTTNEDSLTNQIRHGLKHGLAMFL